jgi:hypothetical protein
VWESTESNRLQPHHDAGSSIGLGNRSINPLTRTHRTGKGRILAARLQVRANCSQCFRQFMHKITKQFVVAHSEHHAPASSARLATFTHAARKRARSSQGSLKRLTAFLGIVCPSFRGVLVGKEAHNILALATRRAPAEKAYGPVKSL